MASSFSDREAAGMEFPHDLLCLECLAVREKGRGTLFMDTRCSVASVTAIAPGSEAISVVYAL